MTQTNKSLRAKIVRVLIERGESGAYFATSPELKGFLVSKMTIEEVRNDVARAITELYAVCGEEVVVTEVDTGHESEFENSWVAVPAVVAKQALAHA